MTRMVKLEVTSETNSRKRRKKFKMVVVTKTTVRRDFDVQQVR
jgi:hypothetical protein